MRALIPLVVLLTAGEAAAVPCEELPVLFIVQDKSGSMAKAPDGSTATVTNPSKWSTAQQVVPTLATQFSNRLRFGAAMYPGATATFNCTTGTVVAPVSTQPTGVQLAYANAVPGGGTPTAVSLQMTASYLLGLGLTTPAHVLLITDGLPNCNLTLNPTSCTATTPGCANDACGLGAKDCLDDTATVQAAAQLFAAGIKVSVVGFDVNLTAGNNKAVLDAVAAAGGTGAAYLATNQAQLTAVLSQIASGTTTCCRDACQPGAGQCLSGGSVQVCQLDELGCYGWVTQACAPMTTCQAGQCTSCQNQCALGSTRCVADEAQQCVVGSSGCTEWATVDTCGLGELCSEGVCTSCQSCTQGATRCGAGGLETCDLDVASGCTAWHARSCATGSQCVNGACLACNTTCTQGTTRCVGNGVETCIADAAGCTAWQASETCATFCSGGACGMCGTSCTLGTTRCNGSGVQTCVMDANQCPTWGPQQACVANAHCENGLCTECGTTCAQGSTRCGANGSVEVCQLGSSGCQEWTTDRLCDTASGEVCDQGRCVPACHDLCTAGETACTTTTQPQQCVRDANGCTTWHVGAACVGDALCVAGACRDRCVTEEFEICPAGQACVGTADGRVCMPSSGPADGGTSSSPDAGQPSAGADAGAPSGGDGGSHGAVGVDDGPPNGSGAIGGRGMGCGCSTGADAGWVAWAFLTGVAFWRRRARPQS